MSDPATPPNPGSDAAIDAGCTCPVLDNAHGRGVNGLYWIAANCPLHGGTANVVRNWFAGYRGATT